MKLNTSKNHSDQISTYFPILNLNNIEESNPYYDYALKWFDFTLKYNFALFEATATAFESFLSVKDNTVKKIQSTISSSFDATLDRLLNESNLSSSMVDYIDSWLELVNLTDYKKLTRNFHNFLSYANQMLEPLRDSVNRTPSEMIEMKGRFKLLHYKSDFPSKYKT